MARIGGDEFVVLLPACPDLESLTTVARRLLTRLRRPIDFEGQPCRIGGSIGLVLSADYDPPEPDRMIADADAALYMSKRAGRNRMSVGGPRAAGVRPPRGGCVTCGGFREALDALRLRPVPLHARQDL